ncbi:MAM and LDL-receptor class A domain-containing protein 1-like isoform X2 [Mercenaria mercenaria]|uniref:MAM and LDL-receptor class A domain-containing protein 1-like isoform X2 n=1 Tax=Mercenaria mercenaria TaxID=6596 RepID=UPI00234F7CEC|nr:MAM and LDL-receptor class A domain-containing protein 1-like isoform X2 [Mercenaria mercenaria]
MCFKFILAFSLIANIYNECYGQGICDLPDSDTVELGGSCNFNKNTCGYTFPTSLWRTHTESFGGLIYGKIRGDDNGEKQTFALFQSNDPSLNESLVLNSSIVSPEIYTRPVCLKFWFLMPNQNSRLEVFTVEPRGNKTNLVYSHVYSPASQWEEVKVLVNPSNSYKLEFRSTKENNYGYVGVDHIQVLIQKVITTTSTTTTTTTTPPTTTTRPTKTTTILTTELLTTESTTEYTTEPTTTTTTVIPTTETTTEPTTTTTTMPTTESTTLTTTETTTTSTTSTTARETTELPATETSVHSTGCVCSCPTVRTICAGVPLPSTTPASPPTLCDVPADQRSVLDQYSCDFDHGTCGYNISSYPHLWEYKFHRYGDPVAGEIIGDHSPEALGGYVLFNTYNNHVQNGTEHVFQSPALLPFTQYCVSFWYNMPNNESRLQVNAAFDNGTRLLLWKRVGLATNGWNNVRLAVRKNSYFRLQFSSKKENTAGFLAVDSIQVSTEKPRFPRDVRMRENSLLDNSAADDTSGCSCTCPAYHVIDCDKSTHSPPYVKSCRDVTNAVLENDLSCNFDDGNSCKYVLPVYPHVWDLISYRYGNNTVGIIDGDTSKEGTGTFAAFTTDNHRVPLGEGGDMVSTYVMRTGNQCLSFWYNMPTDVATLSISTDNGSQRTLLWSKSHVITKGWQQATILLSGNETFKLVFSSKKLDMDGYFGIDDIQFYTIK